MVLFLIPAYFPLFVGEIFWVREKQVVRDIVERENFWRPLVHHLNLFWNFPLLTSFSSQNILLRIIWIHVTDICLPKYENVDACGWIQFEVWIVSHLPPAKVRLPFSSFFLPIRFWPTKNAPGSNGLGVKKCDAKVFMKDHKQSFQMESCTGCVSYFQKCTAR